MTETRLSRKTGYWITIPRGYAHSEGIQVLLRGGLRFPICLHEDHQCPTDNAHAVQPVMHLDLPQARRLHRAGKARLCRRCGCLR